jgi:hypothetical protein
MADGMSPSTPLFWECSLNILLAGEEPVVTQTPILSAEIVGDGTVKLFNKWSFEEVEVKDISLT